MKESQPKTILLNEYKPSCWQVQEINLEFILGEEGTLVTSRVLYSQNPLVAMQPLVLDGEQLELINIRLDGKDLDANAYELTDSQLIINELPEEFELETTVRTHPETNTSLEGLYQSSGNFCTQCEAQGFRKITYYLDRPDVMSSFTTRIVGDKAKYPVLLSNGNLLESGDLDDGKHYAVWNDPHKKPSYLFALVAGNLEFVEDHFNTVSGRDVTLRIYTEAHNIDRCDHAMASLKRAMAWDEQRFGLEYDLDIYMIVAVDDFNMGAMENKGLNVFNSSLVFASPETATDSKYIFIEAVIGHEYFHNWTGNRVTCRDWFQLSLKEGLTVFRDQEFTSDLHSRAVKRIEDVRKLRSYQFAEDASPMAHPIRPSSYMEINNFYTLTVYEKGAEVVRLYYSLLGRDGFRMGMDLYFKRHDGQAVTTEDFLAAMADANHVDLRQMQRWYDQAGTPVVNVSMTHDASAKTCTLTFRQSCPPTPEASEKLPFLIPVEMGLLDAEGHELPLQMEGENKPEGNSRTIKLTQEVTTVTFVNIANKPIPSLLRGYSAPVKLEYPYAQQDYIFLMSHDSDAFNRWQASQELAMQTLLALVQASENAGPMALSHEFIEAYQQVLDATELDEALRAEALALPGCSDVAERLGNNVDPQAVYEAVEFLVKTLANALRIDFHTQYAHLNEEGGYQIDPASMGRRKLKNLCLYYLSHVDDPSTASFCYDHFKQANNMTDSLAGLSVLSNLDGDESARALHEFEQRWMENPQVMDSWFSVQAVAKKTGALEQVKQLMQHEKFNINNPNKVRSLIGAFAGNFRHFHALDGSGYAFLADQVLALDAKNPQIASRMVRALMKWRQFEPQRSDRMKGQLERIAKHEGLSGDVFEIVSKSLAD